MLFNATNIHLAVNGNWLKDAASITHQQQGGVDPLYGYMDRNFRTVCRKQNIVAGTVGIYFREHDRFFRYLAGSGFEQARTEREQEQDRIRREVERAINAGELLTLLSTLDLKGEEFKKYMKIVQDVQGVRRPNRDPYEQYRIENADVLGDSAHKMLASGNGARLDIYYGSEPNYFQQGEVFNTRVRGGAENDIETLYNVWIIGRAKTPIENSPRAGAEPVMEFYSFIASRIGRPT